MNIRVTPSNLERAHNAVGQPLERAADIIESWNSTVIGVFPAEGSGEPWRAHHLSGAIVDAIDDDVVIIRFESSAASFAVKQELRRREEDRKREQAEREKAKRSARG